jgi:hypothetical protein
MKQTIKLFGIIAIVAIVGFSFAACGDAEQGPAGPKGDTGAAGPQGQDGLPGQAGSGGLAVWDNSTPPQILGYHLEGGASSNWIYFLNPTGYVFAFNIATGVLSSDTIYFTQAGQQGDPLTSSSTVSKRVFFNPHSGGTFYVLTSGSVTGYSSYYDSNGIANSATSGSSTYYRLRTAT